MVKKNGKIPGDPLVLLNNNTSSTVTKKESSPLTSIFLIITFKVKVRLAYSSHRIRPSISGTTGVGSRLHSLKDCSVNTRNL